LTAEHAVIGWQARQAGNLRPSHATDFRLGVAITTANTQ
jgi:hypothetical protein